jgi:ketosteroid isomerase-like protein
MSKESLELVKAIWPHNTDLVALSENPEAFAHVATAVAPDIEVAFRSNASGAPNPNYRGLAGFVEGWRDWLEPYRSYWIEVEDYIDAGGDKVLTPSRVQARTRRDDVLIEHSPAAVVTVRDGKVTQVTFYLDRAQAFEALGLRE